MNVKNTQMRIKTMSLILRIALCIQIICWIFLILNKEITTLRYATFFGSLIFGMAFSYLVHQQSKWEKWDSDSDKIFNNVAEAQKILQEKNFFPTKYISKKNHAYGDFAVRFTAENFIDFLRSPITAVACVAISIILAFHPIYIQLQEAGDFSTALIVKTLFLCILQFLFLSLFTAVTLLAFLNFYGKDKK